MEASAGFPRMLAVGSGSRAPDGGGSLAPQGRAILATAMSLLASADPDLILQQLSNDLMSPYCPGRTIAACPSSQARKLEDHILAEAEAGKSREQIETALVQRFGSEIVGYAPPPMLLYGSVIVGFLALGAVIVTARRWVRRSSVTTATAAAGSAPAADGLTQADRDRIEDALDEVDGF